MKQKIFKTSLFYGLIAGVLCFVFFIALYFSSSNPLGLRRPDIGFNILFIFLAIFMFRKSNDGVLHFYEGFSIGFLTNLIAATTTGLLIYLFIELIDEQPLKEWMQAGIDFVTREKESLSKSEVLDEENFKLQIASFENAKPYQIFLDEIMFKQLCIIAISLISMALRKHSKT